MALQIEQKLKSLQQKPVELWNRNAAVNRISLIKYAVLGYITCSGLFLVWSALLRRYSKLFFWILGSLLLVIGTIFYAFGIEPYWVRVHKVTVQDAALAEVIAGYKIVHITDVHLTQGLGFREKQLISKINALKPDLLFFTGDLMDSADQVPAAQELVRSLRAKIGVFGLPGDTDRMVMDEKSFGQAFSSAGLEMVLNKNRQLKMPNGKTLWLVGRGPSSGSQTVPVVPPEVPVIMLTHSPAAFDQAAEEGINLVLAGDTHGGQIGIPWLVRMSRYAYRGPYMKGVFKKKGTVMSVSNGIGTKSIPVRFLCPPEISVIEVKA